LPSPSKDASKEVRAPKGALRNLLMCVVLRPQSAVGQSMGGMPTFGSGSQADASKLIYTPSSLAADSHSTSVLLDWNAVVRQLVRGTTFGDWSFEDPNPFNQTSRVGRFLSPPLPPAEAARTAALVNVAMREALSPLVQPGLPGAWLGPGWGGVGLGELIGASAWPGAAASYAAHYVLCTLYPLRKQSMFSNSSIGFDGVLARHLSSSGYGLQAAWGVADAILSSQRVGVAAARIAVQLAAADGFDIFSPFDAQATFPCASSGTPGMSPNGCYIPTGCALPALCVPANDTGLRAPDSHLGVLTPQTALTAPLSISAAADWVPAPPSSADWNAGLGWVRSFGEANSSARSISQTESAYFWRLGPNTGGVGGLWSSFAAAQLDATSPSGVSGGGATDLWAAADLLARLSVAIWDATLVCSFSKMSVAAWRPETALRSAHNLPWWTPELTNPAEPEWPSMHATLCGVGAAVLSAAFPNASHPFYTLTSEDLLDARSGAGALDLSQPSAASFFDAVTSGAFNLRHAIGNYAAAWWLKMPQSRTFDSFAAMAAECAESRLFGGVSVNASVNAGLLLGEDIGSWLALNYPGQLGARGAAASAMVQALYGPETFSSQLTRGGPHWIGPLDVS